MVKEGLNNFFKYNEKNVQINNYIYTFIHSFIKTNYN